jgi:predicted ester cyclase
MGNANLSDLYRDYVACLNAQNWANLETSWTARFSTTIGRSGPKLSRDAGRQFFGDSRHKLREEKIVRVWSVIDKAAIEAQL